MQHATRSYKHIIFKYILRNESNICAANFVIDLLLSLILCKYSTEMTPKKCLTQENIRAAVKEK